MILDSKSLQPELVLRCWFKQEFALAFSISIEVELQEFHVWISLKQ